MKSIHITLCISLIYTSIHQKTAQPHNTATSCKSIGTASPSTTFNSIYEAIPQKTYELFKNKIIVLGPRDRSAPEPVHNSQPCVASSLGPLQETSRTVALT
jgi:hypothetical protein